MDTFSLYTSNMSQTCILCGQVLATKYFSTRFVKVSVEKVPWLVDRLQVQVLPCVGCFIGGKLKHRCVTVSWRKGSQCGTQAHSMPRQIDWFRGARQRRLFCHGCPRAAVKPHR